MQQFEQLTIRYKDSTAKPLRVILVQRWKRGDIDHQIMSSSGGAKEMIRNWIFEIFDKYPAVDAVCMVLGNRTPFLITHAGGKWIDADGKECDVRRADIKEGKA